jgi:hypothetical protein
MNKLWKFVLIFSTIGIILACNYPSAAPTPTSQPNVATIVASTLQVVTAAAQTSAAQTPTATPTPQGLPVTYVNINLLVPPNLANGTTNNSTTGIEFPYTNPSFGNMPQHTKIILNGYPVQGASLQPQILEQMNILTMAMVTSNLFSAFEICTTNMDNRCRETFLPVHSTRTSSRSTLQTAMGSGISRNLIRVRFRSTIVNCSTIFTVSPMMETITCR